VKVCLGWGLSPGVSARKASLSCSCGGRQCSVPWVVEFMATCPSKPVGGESKEDTHKSLARWTHTQSTVVLELMAGHFCHIMLVRRKS
jgi:hypothetical protein